MLRKLLNWGGTADAVGNELLVWLKLISSEELTVVDVVLVSCKCVYAITFNDTQIIQSSGNQ